MNKKYIKMLIFIIIIGIIGFSAYFANAFLGNPVSKMMAKHTAKAYLEEEYPETDYYIDSVKYSFKEGGYNAHVYSKTSSDSRFTFYINMLGGMKYDSYEEDVKNRFNTARRIDMEYRELTDTVFESPEFPFKSRIAFGTLEIAMEENIIKDDPYLVAPYSLKQDELELDKIYDIKQLGEKAGHLIIYTEDSEVTMEQTAAIMLEIKKQFDEAGVPFAAMDFSLSTPRDESDKDTKNISVAQFLYEEIYEEGMVERVNKESKKLAEYYAEEKK